MNVGTVTVGDDESASGTGLALDLFNAIKAESEAEAPLPSLTPPATWEGTQSAWEQAMKPTRLRIVRSWAREARAHATIVTYLQTNAQVKVLTTDAGLQRDPSSLDPTLAPSADVTGCKLV